MRIIEAPDDTPESLGQIILVTPRNGSSFVHDHEDLKDRSIKVAVLAFSPFLTNRLDLISYCSCEEFKGLYMHTFSTRFLGAFEAHKII